MKKWLRILMIVLILILSKFWIGIYEDDEWGEKRLFVKHRAIWKTYYHSPRGMSDLKISEMTKKKQIEQLLFDEFVLKIPIEKNE